MSLDATELLALVEGARHHLERLELSDTGVVICTAALARMEKVLARPPRVAILDVFREEPLPASSPLWAHPSVRVTAHTSAAGSGTVARGDKLFLDNLALYARGAKLINEIDESFF